MANIVDSAITEAEKALGIAQCNAGYSDRDKAAISLFQMNFTFLFDIAGKD